MTVINHPILKQITSPAKKEKDMHLTVRIQIVALAKQGSLQAVKQTGFHKCLRIPDSITTSDKEYSPRCTIHFFNDKL